jgi:hypothetical protein
VRNFRRQVELRVGPLLVLISRLPAFVIFLATMGCVFGGLALGGFGLALVALVLLLVAAQLFFAWPVLPPPQRALRLAVIVLVAGLAVSRI